MKKKVEPTYKNVRVIDETIGKKVMLRENGTKRVATFNPLPSMTDPSFSERADMNNIMSFYRKTGQINHLNKRQGLFADVSSIKDLGESLQAMKMADEAFMALPSDIRARFRNSPVEFVNFMGDPANLDEAVSLGILKKTAGQVPPEPQPPKAEGSTTKNVKPNKDSSPTNDDD